ncbi:MAG: dihydrofolate reductase [Hyphomicrobiaceae bacterium]
MTASSLKQAFALACQLADKRGVDEIIIAGGGEIYQAALPFADIVHLDLIEASPDGDAVFPHLDAAEWRQTSHEHVAAGEKDDHAMVAISYERHAPART